MKIGITCYPTYGGSGAVATELGLDLARRGHEVHFITYDSPFRLRGYVERAYFHEVDTAMSRYPLFEHYPYTLALASRQYEVALQENWTCCMCTTRSRMPRPPFSPARCCAANATSR